MSESIIVYDENKLKILRNTYGKNLTPDEFETFVMISKSKGLDISKNEIYAIKRKDKNGNFTISYQTSIDGYRKIAAMTGMYAGTKDYLFNEGLTQYQLMTKIKNDKTITLTTATATIIKIINGKDYEFSATASWESYYPGETMGMMWRKFPYLMLGKVAEAQVLRRCFPFFEGIYLKEEMQNANNDIDLTIGEVETTDYQLIEPAEQKVETTDLTKFWTDMTYRKIDKELIRTYMNINFNKGSSKDLTVKEFEQLKKDIDNGKLL